MKLLKRIGILRLISLLLSIIAIVVSIISLSGCSSTDDILMNPSIEEVSAKITNIDGIINIGIVTEDNDHNGKLNKPGGYTGALYFTYDLISDDNSLDPIAEGTDGGGSIEVYSTVEDAESRDALLGAFDGTIFSSGSHIVIGTIVIRTSDNLTASQQSILEEAIIVALGG